MTVLRLPVSGPFVAKLTDNGDFANRTTLPGIIVSNESGEFSITFPRRDRLLDMLEGFGSVYRMAELVNGCVLVIGPEAPGWDQESKTYFTAEGAPR